MGEINFLADDDDQTKSDAKPKNNNTDKQIVSQVEWTKPLVDDKNKSSVSSFSLKKKSNNQAKEKDRIEKSREEVLEMIDKNKKNKSVLDKKTKKNAHDKPKVKSSSWINKIFAKKEKGFKNKNNENQDTIKSNEKEAKPVVNKSEKLKKSIKAKDKKSENFKTKTQTTKQDSPLMFSANNWNSAGVLETNLIDKSEFNFFDSEKKFKYIFISVLGAVLLVGILYLVLLFWENMELDKLKQRKAEIETLKTKVIKMEKTLSEPKKFQKELDTAVKLLDKHIYWTNFFNFLEQKTLANVYYQNGFSGGIDGKYNLLARTSDYLGIKNQLTFLAQDQRISKLFVDEVKNYEEIITPEIDLNNLNQSEEATTTEVITERGVEFDLNFNIDKEIFYKFNQRASSTDEESCVEDVCR